MTLPDNPYNLPIPPRPEGPEPELRPGWQWARTDWLAYWLMTNQGINNREKNLKRPCAEIRAAIDGLRWWQEHPLGSQVYQEVTQTLDPREIEANLYNWCRKYKMTGDDSYLSPIPEFLDHFHVLTTFTYPFHQIRWSISAGQAGDGRHRIYAAWKCQQPEIFLLIVP